MGSALGEFQSESFIFTSIYVRKSKFDSYLGNTTSVQKLEPLLRAGTFQRDFFIDNLLFRIHVIIVVIGWAGLAPWGFECPFSSSLVCASQKVRPLLGAGTFHLWVSGP